MLNEREVRKEIGKYLRAKGIRSLYKHQKEAINLLWKSVRNAVVSFSTGGGKTLVAEVMILREVLWKNKKAVYVVPLKALANEKQEDFSLMKDFGIEVRTYTGDSPLRREEVEDADVIITTIEKFDSSIRNDADWLYQIGLVVIDEFHILGTPGRGGRVENIIRKADEVGWRVIGLSATIPNIEEIADWMHAVYYEGSERPVFVHLGVYCSKCLNKIEWVNSEPELDFSRVGKDWRDVVRTFYEAKKQVLVFVPTRRNAENFARKLIEYFEDTPYSPRIEFYHGGLRPYMRRKLEDEFRNRKIDVMVSTSALAMGVNFPADAVIIKGLSAMNEYGMGRLSPEMLWQMIGRAGRPGYSDVGYAVVITSSEHRREFVKEFYFGARVKKRRIKSFFLTHPVFRNEMLGWIYEKESLSFRQLIKLVKKTLWYYQFRDMKVAEKVIFNVLDFLFEEGMIEAVGDTLVITDYGREIARSYIDPFTAVEFIQLLNDGVERGNVSLFNVFNIIVHSYELDLPSVRKAEAEILMDEFKRNFDMLLFSGSLPEEELVKRYKLLKIMWEYLKGVSPYTVASKYNIGLTELDRWRETFGWQLFALSHLLNVVDEEVKDEWSRFVSDARIMVRHRVRPELIPLMRFGVDKKTAERLYKMGVRSLDNLSPEELRELGVPRKVINRLIDKDVKVYTLEDFMKR